MQKIYYFRLTKEKKFKMIYGYLVKITEHELRVSFNSHVYVIRSDYNLLEMLNGEILDAFLVKPKFSKYYKLRPLPPKAEFNDSLLESEFPYMSLEQRKEIIYDDPEIVAKYKKQELLAEELRENLRRSQEFAYSQVMLAQTFPLQTQSSYTQPLRTLTENDNVGVFCIQKNKDSQITKAQTSPQKAKESILSSKWEKRVKDYLNR